MLIPRLIRRHMAQVLTELMSEHPENEAVQRVCWARSVLGSPLCAGETRDGETRVRQEKALECADISVDSYVTYRSRERARLVALGYSHRIRLV